MSVRTRTRILIALTAAFALRVTGQLVVTTARPAWLPPPEFWQSGLLAYPVLLGAQLAILGLQLAVVLSSFADRDPLRPGPRAARRVRAVARVYGAAMALRPFATLAVAPELHPARSLIPSVFHAALAGFLLVWADSERVTTGVGPRVLRWSQISAASCPRSPPPRTVTRGDAG